MEIKLINVLNNVLNNNALSIYINNIEPMVSPTTLRSSQPRGQLAMSRASSSGCVGLRHPCQPHDYLHLVYLHCRAHLLSRHTFTSSCHPWVTPPWWCLIPSRCSTCLTTAPQSRFWCARPRHPLSPWLVVNILSSPWGSRSTLPTISISSFLAL